MARILVFGAGGYIGIPLCETLVSRGHFVQPADRFFFGKCPDTPGPQLQADIRSYECGEGLFDIVIDLAGLSNDASADIDPAITRSINHSGAMHLADVAKRVGVKRYIYSSSCSVYGHNEGVCSEATECRPLTLYARCKTLVEEHLRAITDNDFSPIILRNATVFGVAPRMRFDLAVNIMTLRAWRDHLIYIMGGGKQVRPFVHVLDVVLAFIWAVETDICGTFNVGSNAMNCSIEQLAGMVGAEFPMAALHRIPDDPDKRSYRVSFDAIQRFGALPHRRTITDGIQEIKSALMSGEVTGDDETAYTLDWYKKLIAWNDRLDKLRIDGRLL